MPDSPGARYCFTDRVVCKYCMVVLPVLSSSDAFNCSLSKMLPGMRLNCKVEVGELSLACSGKFCFLQKQALTKNIFVVHSVVKSLWKQSQNLQTYKKSEKIANISVTRTA